MFNLEKELERLREKYPDPLRGAQGLIEFERRQVRDMALPKFGTVADNKDPLCLGRLRVASDLIAPGAVTGWIPFAAIGASKGSGWWQLPDIGTQVLMVFLWNNVNSPVVLGCLYDEKHRPPKHSTANAADSIVYQSKKHRLEIIDEPGKESIIISTAKGKIRYEQGPEGIKIINELGGIRIKCRKLTIAAGSGIKIEGRKKISLNSGGTAKIQAKNIRMECEKEITFKGKNIRLKGSKGVTTEGKQLAAEGDRVMGFDIHQMVVPSGSGTAVVPLPHPYLGKLVEEVSDNVKLNGHGAAVKGSKSKHDDAMHLQLPGTIKFNQPPDKKGEVTGGTGKKVKINGKEVAVIGSTVTTCNDVGAKENSVIMAAGASMPMPVIINPKNTKEWEEERVKEEKKDPGFTTMQWGKGSVEEGEEVELSAGVKDIGEGNGITFQVWKAGQDPAVHIALDVIVAAVSGGVAKGKWGGYLERGAGLPPEEDPKFYFTAHSAWCQYKKSGEITVKLKRPELRGPKWVDGEGAETDKGVVGEVVKLAVECNGDMEEGDGVMFRVYAAGADPKRDRPEYERGAENLGGKAEAEWTYRYKHDPENPLKEKPKFFFTVTSRRCKEVKSANVEIGMNVETALITKTKEVLKEVTYELYLSDGSVIKGEPEDDGTIRQENIIPCGWKILFKKKKENRNG